MKKSRKLGFTLTEVVTAVTLFVIVIALALGGYLFSMKNVNQGDVQNELDIDVQLAMERLKTDLRLSSLDAIFYHPAGAGPYQAISFPLAHDTDGDGVLEKDNDGNLLWDETVIYHIRPTTPNQLVRTTFKPRDNTLTDAQRQAQLEHVVKFGYGDNTYNGQNAYSDVIFENLLTWQINAEQGQFDAYSSFLTRDSSILGYILLDSGNHEFTFTVVDKNSKSSGYKIGVDQLFVSPSFSPREGEAQLPASRQSGGIASSLYMSGDWKGNHQLYFPATGVGNTFTLNIENDRWEETNFGALGYEAENAEIVFDDSLSPSDFVVKLNGNDITWDASLQTGSDPIDPLPGQMQNWCVRVMQKGSELADNGNWFDYNGRKCRLNFKAGNTGSFKITNVYIGETSSATNASLDFNEATITPVSFAGGIDSPVAAPGGSILSDWIDFPIDKEKNYLVSYRIANNAAYCHPAIWNENRGSVTATSMVVTNGTGATAKDKTWSGQPGIDPVDVDGIIGLDSIMASHPAEGKYTSQIFDTHLDAPRYNSISWNADIPSGTALTMKVRSGSQPDLTDASDWTTVSASSVNPRSVSAAYKRYIQFQAILSSDPDGLLTPALKDVTIDWAGERQLVNVGGIFTKGPDYGIFNISVDGEPLRSALIVDLEIFKESRVLNNKIRRLTSSLKADLTPRNTGM